MATSVGKFDEITHMQGTERAFLHSLGHGVSKIDGIAELMDNAVDNGKHIDITHNMRSQRVTILNDNKAFPISHLVRVLSNAEFHGKKGDKTISKFGVGLKKAVVALCDPRFQTTMTIISCDGVTAPYGLTWKLWEDFAREESILHREMSFEDYGLTPFVGTCIIIDNCKLTSYEIASIKKDLAITYSRKLSQGWTITFNGEAIVPYDPMYVHELGERLNREGLHDYFINNKAFRVINVEAFHKSDPDLTFPIRLLGLFIPKRLLDLPNRDEFIHPWETNDTKLGGIATSLCHRYLNIPSDNTSKMIGKPNKKAASRKRECIDFDQNGADVFKIEATKHHGIPSICQNEELQNFRIRVGGQSYRLDRYICKYLWEWTELMRQHLDLGDDELSSISSSVITKWSVDAKSKEDAMPSYTFKNKTNNISVDEILTGENAVLPQLTEQHLARVLSSLGIGEDTINMAIQRIKDLK